MVFQYAINMKNIVSLEGGFINLISNERKKRISRFNFMKNKIHCLLAEVLLRYALWTHYNLMSEQIEFRCTSYGKPYLVDRDYIYFNLSHSGDWVICVVGDCPLGIDVEQIKGKDLSLAISLYSKEECQYLLNQSLEERLKSFFRIWTLKESYVKYKGQGLSIPFDSFSFGINQDNIHLYVNGRQDNKLSFFIGQLDELHCTALCVDTAYEHNVNEKVKIITMNDLLEWKEMVM